MPSSAVPSASRNLIRESLRIAGEKVPRDRHIEIRHPYSGELIGTAPKATLEDVRRALRIARGFKSPLTRHERYKILMKAGAIIAAKREDLARLITLESGLCLKDVRLCLAAAESLGVPLGVGSAVCELLQRTVSSLGADTDFTAMAKIVESDAGLDPNRSA